MIEFKGKPSDACVKFVVNVLRKIYLIAYLILAVVLIIPTVYFTITFSKLCILGLLIYIILALIIVFYKLPEDKHDLIVPNRVVINKSSMTTKSTQFEVYREVSQVKKVIDYGKWYFITFYFPNKCESFVCEKSLLTQGTIEEFETLFEGKIKRKYRE